MRFALSPAGERQPMATPDGVDDPFPAAPRGPQRYQVLEEIARGGMGAVYRARDLDSGGLAALKVLHEEHVGRPDMVRRFLEEALVASRLRHPGVVPIQDIGRLPD